MHDDETITALSLSMHNAFAMLLVGNDLQDIRQAVIDGDDQKAYDLSVACAATVEHLENYSMIGLA